MLANSYRIEGAHTEAVARYGAIIAEVDSDDRWMTMVYLNRGKSHDMMGQRDNALKDYRAVLKRRDVWQMHDQAEKYIKKPYNSKDPSEKP
jgi:hypothetical protein